MENKMYRGMEEVIRDEIRDEQITAEIEKVIDVLDRRVAFDDPTALYAVDKLIELYGEKLQLAEKYGYITGFVEACYENAKEKI